MDYIYRYIDNNDGIVKYIGRSKRKLDCRISEHENLDNWIKNGNWKIEYITVPNQSYSESLESHLIAFYKTYQWYNKAKANWGIIQEYLNYNFKWKLYSDNDYIINLQYEYLPIFTDRKINNQHELISDKELSFEFELPIEFIWKLAKKGIIQPLAKTEQEDLLFIDDSIEEIKNYLDKYIEIERD